MKNDQKGRRIRARVLAAMQVSGTRLVNAAGRYELTRSGASGPLMIVEAAVVSDMLSSGLLARSNAGLVAASTAQAWLARHDRPEEPWRAQHMSISAAADESGRPVLVVDDESPIAWLRKRRDAEGVPMISAVQFAAGERLRADYTAARMLPRVTADWSGMAAPQKRRGPPRDPAESTDIVVAARQRVEGALDAVGSELASLLVDVCCYLVGIEEAEKARRWPRRSAKVVLRLALSALARHYGLDEEARGPDRARRILHFGTDDYRPKA